MVTGLLVEGQVLVMYGFSDITLTGFWDVHAGSDIFAAKLQTQNFGRVFLDQFQVSLDAVVDGHLESTEANIDKLSDSKRIRAGYKCIYVNSPIIKTWQCLRI